MNHSGKSDYRLSWVGLVDLFISAISIIMIMTLLASPAAVRPRTVPRATIAVLCVDAPTLRMLPTAGDDGAVTAGDWIDWLHRHSPADALAARVLIFHNALETGCINRMRNALLDRLDAVSRGGPPLSPYPIIAIQPLDAEAFQRRLQAIEAARQGSAG